MLSNKSLDMEESSLPDPASVLTAGELNNVINPVDEGPPNNTKPVNLDSKMEAADALLELATIPRVDNPKPVDLDSKMAAADDSVELVITPPRSTIPRLTNPPVLQRPGPVQRNLRVQVPEVINLDDDMEAEEMTQPTIASTGNDTATLHTHASSNHGVPPNHVEIENPKTKIRNGIITLFFKDDVADPKFLTPEYYIGEPKEFCWNLSYRDRDMDVGVYDRYDDSAEEFVSVWCGQFELCPSTGKLHAHIHFELKKQVRFPWLRDKMTAPETIAGMSLTRARKISHRSRDCSINYCLDPSKRKPGNDSNFYIWPGNERAVAFQSELVKKRKKRDDDNNKRNLDEIKRKWIESKPINTPWDEIVHENDESKQLFFGDTKGKKYHEGRGSVVPRRTIKEVVFMYGAGGTGKTTLAMEYGKYDQGVDVNETDSTRYYKRNFNDGIYWGGGRTAYKGQRVVHLEEYCGQEKFNDLKQIMDIDKPGPPINIKNSGADLNHEIVVITSNVHPSGWYRKSWMKDTKQFHPFWRRVTKLLFFPSHRADGTINAPDANHIPVFFDQTNDWKAMNGNYQAALEHAEQFWPLREDDDGEFAPTFNNDGVAASNPLAARVVRYAQTNNH